MRVPICLRPNIGPRPRELPANSIDSDARPQPGDRPESRGYQVLSFGPTCKAGRPAIYEGNFGLAQRYFQDAVESTPADLTAWIGLAASYDRLGRFDLADRAYAAAVKLGGNSPKLLNNEGYSYMLRGDLKQARTKFEAALKLDPTNQTTINNLTLLNSSSRFVDRASNGEPCGSVDCGQ